MYVQNTCEPDCAAGNYSKLPASIVLSSPGVTTWGTLFTQAQITYINGTGQTQSTNATYPQIVSH